MALTTMTDTAVALYDSSEIDWSQPFVHTLEDLCDEGAKLPVTVAGARQKACLVVSTRQLL